MIKSILWSFAFIIMSSSVKSQGHALRPGVSASYLPALVVGDADKNIKGNIWMWGFDLNQEIWKESYLSIGVMKSQWTVEYSEVEEYSGIIIPVRLQKYFNEERKGFNLSFTALSGFCSDCRTSFNMAFSEEISYLFRLNPIHLNVGFQIMEGALFEVDAINVGLRVQLLLALKKEE